MRVYCLFFLLFIYVVPVTAQTSGKQFSFFAGAGAGRTYMDIYGSGSLGTMDFENMDYLNAIAGAEWFPRKLPKLAVRLETVYKTFDYSAKGSDLFVTTATTYNIIEGFHITPSLCLLYDFIRSNKLRVYAGGGAGVNFNHFSKQEYVWASEYLSIAKDYELLRDTWFSQELRAGAVYRNVDASFFLTKGRIGKERASYVVDLLSLGFQLNYHL